jgi:Ribonucleotide reductase N-terminal.
MCVKKNKIKFTDKSEAIKYLVENKIIKKKILFQRSNK